jgi:hypothetical protein
MSGLTSKYLEDFGKKYCNTFLGVYPSDLHPNIKDNSKFSLIFNESKHDQEGTHFVGVYATRKRIFLMDSLGLKCENENILEFLKSSKRDIVETKKQIQSFDSIYCGYFSIAFILFMCVHESPSMFLRIFSTKNLEANNKIVVDLIICLLKKIK